MWIVDEAVIKFQPSMVFLHVGTNDMGNTVMRSYREIALNISMIVNLIKKNLPTCKIYVLSPLPCLESLQDFNHANGVRSNLFIENYTKHYLNMLNVQGLLIYIMIFLLRVR